MDVSECAGNVQQVIVNHHNKNIFNLEWVSAKMISIIISEYLGLK